MDKHNFHHWRSIKDRKILEMKKLKEKNDEIYIYIIRSPAYTERQKENYKDDYERNSRQIERLHDEIYEIDCKLKAFHDTKAPVDRGRSRTREQNRRCTSTSPGRHSPRSVSRGRSRTRERHYRNASASPCQHYPRPFSRLREPEKEGSDESKSKTDYIEGVDDYDEGRISDRLSKLQIKNNKLKEKLESIQKAYQRECLKVNRYQKNEKQVTQTVNDILKGNEQLEKEKKEETEKLHRLLQAEKLEKDQIEEKLGNKIECLERQVKELHLQKRTSEREVTRLQNLHTNLSEEKKGLMEKLRKLETDVFNLQQQLQSSENAYRNTIDNLKHEIEELQKKYYLLQVERDELKKNDETEQKEAEKLQRELEDAKMKEEKLCQRINELERSESSESSEEIDESAALTPLKAAKEFKGIFSKEWKEAFQALSNFTINEKKILRELNEVLQVSIEETASESKQLSKRLHRFKYMQFVQETVMKMSGVAAVVPFITEKILGKLTSGDHYTTEPVPFGVKTLVRRCTEMLLIIQVVFPQLSIVSQPDTLQFDQQKYDVYSGEGNTIDILVWPCIIESDTVLQKGQVIVHDTFQNVWAFRRNTSNVGHKKCKKSDSESTVRMKSEQNKDEEEYFSLTDTGDSLFVTCPETDFELTAETGQKQ